MRYFFILLLPFLSCNAQTVSTQNGLIAAIHAAKQNGGTVNISGEMLINQKIEIDFDCVINGGVLKTKDSTTTSFNLFEVKKGGRLTCNNLTVLGPKYAGGATENVPFTTAFFMESGAQLRLNNCNIYGQFNNAISKTSTGDSIQTKSVLVINGGEIEAFAQCVSFFTVNNNKECFFECSGVKFLNSGIPAAQNNGNAYGHTLYVHPNVNTVIDGCYFVKSERNCISYFSGAAITSGGSLTVKNCVFGELCKGAIYSKNAGQTDVYGNKFLGLEGVRAANGVYNIYENYFIGNYASNVISTVNNIELLNIRDNYFKPTVSASYYGSAVLALYDIGTYNVLDNYFCGTYNNGSIIVNMSNALSFYKVMGNMFFCNSTYGANCGSGTYNVKWNTFKGITSNVNYNQNSVKYVQDGN